MYSFVKSIGEGKGLWRNRKTQKLSVKPISKRYTFENGKWVNKVRYSNSVVRWYWRAMSDEK